MATAVGHHEGHGLDLPTRITRARMGAILLILSDAGFVAALYASQAYLHILNVRNLWYSNGDRPPAIGTGFILALVIIVSAAIYFWGWRRLVAGDIGQYRMALWIAWILAVIAFIAQIVVFFTLNYPTFAVGAGTGYTAYASISMLGTGYHAVHLFLTVLIGFLLIGRVRNNRIVGSEYVAEVSGYYWYYVAITAFTTWLMLSFAK